MVIHFVECGLAFQTNTAVCCTLYVSEHDIMVLKVQKTILEKHS